MPSTDRVPPDFRPLVEIIRSSERILVSSHVMPDGDNIGAICAVGLALEKAGYRVTMANMDPVPRLCRFLSGQEKITDLREQSVDDPHDLFLLLDCSDETRVGRGDFLRLGRTVVSLDHHAGNTMFAQINIVEPRMSSTCELVYHLLRALELPLDEPVATALFTGMTTDTIRFLTSACTPGFYRIVAELVAAGASPADVGTACYMNYSPGASRLLGQKLQDFTLECDGALSWCLIRQEEREQFGATLEDTGSVVNHILSVHGVEASIVFETEGDRVHLSMRSKTAFDVGAIARSLGGGGHLNAAGAVLPGGAELCRPIIDRVAGLLREYLAQHPGQ